MGEPIHSPIMGTKRTARVMVRLAPGKSVPPDEVRFTEDERKAVEVSMVRAGYTAISTFIREVGVDSAMSTVRRIHPIAGPLDDYQLTKTAAEDCNLPLGEWLRLVVLSAVGHMPLRAHMEAGAGFVAGRVRATAEVRA